MSRVSGTVSDDCRILVYDTASQGLEYDQLHSAGAYEIGSLLNGEKVITAVRTSDDKALSYGGVLTYLENIEVQRSVATGADDGWYSQEGSWNPTWAAIYVLDSTGGPQADYQGWIRFTNINVSQGQTLDSATLRVYFEQNLGSGKQARIYCDDTDNAAAPTGASNAYNRTRTSAYIQPTIDHSPAGGYIDLDVKSPVQEVINRGGWSPNNAILFLLDHIEGLATSSYWYFSSYESSYPEPRLTLVYEG